MQGEENFVKVSDASMQPISAIGSRNLIEALR